MASQRLAADSYFFDEWLGRRPGTRRDLARARDVGIAVGSLPQALPVVTVVGSKGKGTASIHCAATISAARRSGGQYAKVALVTSPALRTNRERVRLDGAALGPADYEEVGRRLLAARRAVRAGAGYLSPTGAFTLSGAAFASRERADALVLEEGLGGRSDEVSLFSPSMVVLTPVFLEHADLLGGNLRAIAEDLLGVVSEETAVIVTCEQSPEVAEVLREVASRNGAEVLVVRGDGPVPVRSDLSPLTRTNAILGVTAGNAFCGLQGWTLADVDRAQVLQTIELPGRCSRHRTRRGTAIMVDGAISPAGVSATVEEFSSWQGSLPCVIACFPDTKPVEECFQRLSGFAKILPVCAGGDYLDFSRAERLMGQLLTPLEALERAEADGSSILLVGTQSFVGDVLELLDVPMERAYVPLTERTPPTP